jgi:hypothetical protein
MALECVIVQLSKKARLSEDQARDIGWGLRELLLRIKKGFPRRALDLSLLTIG